MHRFLSLPQLWTLLILQIILEIIRMPSHSIANESIRNYSQWTCTLIAIMVCLLSGVAYKSREQTFESFTMKQEVSLIVVMNLHWITERVFTRCFKRWFNLNNLKDSFTRDIHVKNNHRFKMMLMFMFTFRLSLTKLFWIL